MDDIQFDDGMDAMADAFAGAFTEALEGIDLSGADLSEEDQAMMAALLAEGDPGVPGGPPAFEAFPDAGAGAPAGAGGGAGAGAGAGAAVGSRSAGAGVGAWATCSSRVVCGCCGGGPRTSCCGDPAACCHTRGAHARSR